MKEKRRVLIGSPIRQKPKILQEFLTSIQGLDCTGLDIDCFFIDNNDNKEASSLLKGFKKGGSTVYIGEVPPREPYNCNSDTHHWNDRLIWTIAGFKNCILKFALDNNYDYVFMVDSDLVLHPQTLRRLVSTGKEIISEIFWTEWFPNTAPLPQVWAAGQYAFHLGGDRVSEEEKIRQSSDFIEKLKVPGVYEVGGLGACTLISVNTVAKGLNYNHIKNVDYWGEDRHFCIRAQVLGFKLYVDTHYPALHLYREADLEKVSAFKGKAPKGKGSKITLSMIVRNEANRYLRKVLEHAAAYIDEAIIIDDASEDNTVQICRKVFKDIPVKIVKREHSLFSTEYKLRQQQWDETVKRNPDWILILDADEMFENRAIEEIPLLTKQSEYDVFYFRLYDFWSENHYREDSLWKAHLTYRPLLVRYCPGFNYRWQERPLHCGRFPSNVIELRGALSQLRVKHLGWAKLVDREAKYKRYMELDPEGKYGVLEQYRSILDPAPNLIRWEE